MPTIRTAQDLRPIHRRIEKFTARMRNDFHRVMTRSVLLLERAAAEGTPVGVGDSPAGHLRSGIHSEVRGTEAQLRGEVFATPLHGIVVEMGSRPHWPPKGSLASWVHLKLGVPDEEVDRVEFLVRRKIANEGTPAVNMFESGYRSVEARIKRLFEQAFKRVAKEIGGP